ncbi:MAG: ComF family protein [Gammaproteobacteria bacterium]
MRPTKVDGGLAALLPTICLLCGRPARGRNICRGCRADLPWISKPCSRCGAPLPFDDDATQCGACRPALAAAECIRTALVYEYPVDQLVTRMKFQSRAECAVALGELLCAYLRPRHRRGSVPLPDVLVPVPLHRRRQARRGFNQAEWIARPLARSLGLPMLTRSCTRTLHTVEQTSLSGAARRRNIRGAFRVSADLGGMTAAVVDDVLTTGSTAAELAATLRAAGAGSVVVWAVARSLRR